jgi:hypothetical protein
MPYSRSKEKRLSRASPWPDLRYSPTGEAKLFQSAKDVPFGWTLKPPTNSMPRTTQVLDRDELIAELTKKEIAIKPTWGTAHMKKVLDGDCSPTW